MSLSISETNKIIEQLKIVLREEDCPFFSNEELQFYLEQNGHDFNRTAYRCFMLKAENTTLNLSGLETGDTSKYFRRLAQQYRSTNSGVLK